MRLFHSPASPYVRKVMVVLHETGLLGLVQLIPATGTPVDPGSIPVDHNPLGKLPLLLREDGTAIYDSRVITRYLDTRAGAGLYPESDGLWPVLTLEATADGILDAALLVVYESRIRPAEKQFQPWSDGQLAKITRSLDAIEARWLPVLHGTLNAAQIAVGAALDYVDFRLTALAWRADHPGLAAWHAAFSARPSMQATVPKG